MYTFIYDILEYKCTHLYDILEYKMYTFIYDILEYKMYIQCTVNVTSTLAMCSNFQYCLYILGGYKLKLLKLPSSNNLQIKGNNKNFTLCIMYNCRLP